MGKDETKRRYSTNAPKYPKPWTAWEWNPKEQRFWSCQEYEKGRYRYKYAAEDWDKTPKATASVPRVERSKSQVSPVDDQYSTQENYTTDPNSVDQVTGQLENMALGNLRTEIEQNNPRPLAHVTTVDPTTTSEEFDPNYRKHDTWEFKFGKVFKVLWSEPMGTDAKESRELRGGTLVSERQTKFGQTFTRKVRRFVVIDNRKGHCICLPIMTYGGQGTAKRGVHSDDHAIIYITQPIYVLGEARLKKIPIRVHPYNQRHKLEAASRLNYAKVYTVEHNVKVWFIGEIHGDSLWNLTAAYNEVHPALRPRGLQPADNSSRAVSNYPRSSAQPSGFGPGSGGYPPPTSRFPPASTARVPSEYPPQDSVNQSSPQTYTFQSTTDSRVDSQQLAQSMTSRTLPGVAMSTIGQVQVSSYGRGPEYQQQPRQPYSFDTRDYPARQQALSDPYAQSERQYSSAAGSNFSRSDDRTVHQYSDYRSNPTFDDTDLYDE